MKKPTDFKPKIHFGPRHRWPNAQRCQGWRPKLGRQCKKLARKDRRTCRTCGSGGRPPLSGKYTGLAGFSRRIQKNLADPRHLNLRSEIDILGLRLDALAHELLSGESQPAPDIGAIRKLVVSQSNAIRHGDADNLRAINGELIDKLDLLVAEADRWREYRSTARDFAALVGSEASRDLATSNLIPVAIVWQFIEFNQALMFRFIPDSIQRGLYMQELRAMIPRPPLNLIEDQTHENRQSPGQKQEATKK